MAILTEVNLIVALICISLIISDIEYIFFMFFIAHLYAFFEEISV